ncbi:MAG: MFS transporter [Solirubrobacterales bacterium]|nr:MFS transporter [Solirubrobacterales bacterium]
MPSLLTPLSDPVFRPLYAAQMIGLIGFGLSTVALSLLAFQLEPDNAGQVLGIALGLKMVTFVLVAPMFASAAAAVSRKKLLIWLDLVRAVAIGAIAFVDQVWQVYVLIVVLSAAAAGFTPALQAVIPDIFSDVDRYTEALSLTRTSYELEGLLSPVLAAVLLGFIGFNVLFALNAVAFIASAALIGTVSIPFLRGKGTASGRRLVEVTQGVRQYLRVPRLRGLFAIYFGVAAGSAMVITNTVVFVKEDFGLGDQEVAWALGVAGAGSILVAVAVPRLLRTVRDYSLMLIGGGALTAVLFVLSGIGGIASLLLCWFVIGLSLSLVQTPSGRLIQRSADPEGRPALFAAQFSLSHSCWLITYPLAGFVGAGLGLSTAAITLAIVAGAGTIFAVLFWRSGHVFGEAEVPGAD